MRPDEGIDAERKNDNSLMNWILMTTLHLTTVYQDHLPKRKRKKLSSPILHSRNTDGIFEACFISTPQRERLQKKGGLRYAHENKKLQTNDQIPEFQPPLRKNGKHKIPHESTHECKLKKI